MPWATPAYDLDAALAWVRREYDPTARSYLIIDPDDGALVGTCGLNGVSELNRTANLGYWLRTGCTGRGHATEAVRLVAQQGHVGGLHRLEIVMSVDNDASRRVAERAGAVYEGVRRAALLLHGRHHDCHVFSLLPGEVT